MQAEEWLHVAEGKLREETALLRAAADLYAPRRDKQAQL